MKIRSVIVWTIVWVVIEQLIKLVISSNYREANFEMIPSFLAFKPTLNDSSFYWLSLLNIEVGRWARFVTGLIGFSVICLMYISMKPIPEKEKGIRIGFTFGFAGILCSICDNLFFGGSWDYLFLKPLFVFDLKDVYLNVFVVLILFFSYKRKEELDVILKDQAAFVKKRFTRKK